jgi:hypothetical protein
MTLGDAFCLWTPLQASGHRLRSAHTPTSAGFCTVKLAPRYGNSATVGNFDIDGWVAMGELPGRAKPR